MDEIIEPEVLDESILGNGNYFAGRSADIRFGGARVRAEPSEVQ